MVSRELFRLSASSLAMSAARLPSPSASIGSFIDTHERSLRYWSVLSHHLMQWKVTRTRLPMTGVRLEQHVQVVRCSLGERKGMMPETLEQGREITPFNVSPKVSMPLVVSAVLPHFSVIE
jgi:hypothetical protein